MAVIAENHRPLSWPPLEKAKAALPPLEKVSETRPPVHDGVLPEAVQILFEETGVFAAVEKEERRYQELQEKKKGKKIIDIETRRSLEHPVFNVHEIAAAGDY